MFSKSLDDRDDSLIRVQNHHDYLKSIRNKADEIVTMNIRGDRYETRLSTLEIYPDTLLGNKKRRKYYWNNEKKRIFLRSSSNMF